MIVPFRDAWHLTENCLKSIASQRVDSLSVRVVLVDNGSQLPQTHEEIRAWTATPLPNGVECVCLRDDSPFNFSRINNSAVEAESAFRADYLLFLNNDIVLEDAASIRRLVAFLQTRPHAGAVGCTLVYPDRRIQHLFLCPGVRIVAAHPLKGFPFEQTWEWFREPRKVPAVSGALLCLRADHFREVGGFDEGLPTVGQDLDLCLKLESLGLANFAVTSLVAVHHETATRDPEIPKAEVVRLYQRWGDHITWHPRVSRRLSRWSETPCLAFGEGAFPWWRVIS